MSMKFVRYGVVNHMQKQKHYSETGSFHNPPVKRGFYAMPFIRQEFFLIGSLKETQPNLFPKKDYAQVVYEKWKDVIKNIPLKISGNGEDISKYPKEYEKERQEANKKYRKRLREIRKFFFLKD